MTSRQPATSPVPEKAATPPGAPLRPRPTAPHRPSVRLLVSLVLVFLLCHTVVMVLLNKEVPALYIWEPVIESVLLLVLLAPLIYLFVFRPLVAEIKERQQAEQSLRESEERFRAVTQSAKEAIVVADDHGRIVMWNRGAERLFLHPESEILGQPLAMLIPSAKLGRHQHALEQLRATGECQMMGKTFEGRAVRRDGSEFDVEISLAFWDGATGRLYSAIVRDITERKQAETKLHEAELRYRTLFEESPDGIVIMDPETTLPIEFNTEAHRQLGYTREEFARLRIRDYDATETPEETQARVADLLRQGWATFEVKHRTKSGEIQDVRITARNLLLDGRTVFHALWQDITETKRAAEQLRQQAALLDITRDAILVRDLNYAIRYWNKGAERMYGWTAGEAIGRKTKELLYETKIVPTLEAVYRELREKGAWHGELQHVTKGQRKIVVEARLTLIYDPQGNPTSVLCVNTDITEKKLLEQQFLRAQRLESIGTLASGVAHDLNNILSPIMMSADLLQLRPMDKETQTLLETVSISARRGGDIVRQMLTFARGVTGERALVQPRHLIRELAAMARETFPKSIVIKAAPPNDLWPITGDPTQLHQVLLNLCVNARDAMPDGGILTLDAENALLDGNFTRMVPDAKPGAYVRLEVADTGSGIPPEIMDKIFDPFFTTKEPGKGTGLGLSTVLGIVKSHSGFLRIDGEVGRGSTFHVYLPATPAAAAQAAPREQPVPPGRGELILVVDDEAPIRDLTKRTLTRHGYQVIVAGDGAEALALFAQHRGDIKLVITDMMMPVMGGMALIRALRHIDPQIKTIAISGLAEDDKQNRHASGGANRFLSKPCTTEQMLNAVHTVLTES